jgi:flagellar basal body-associated protein FliL
MEWLKSKTPIIAFCSLALVAIEGYAIFSLNKSTEDRLISTENEMRSMYESADAKLTDMASDLDVVTKKMGITAQELDEAQAVAAQLKQENAQMAKRLRREMAAKADSKTVIKLHNDATNKLNEVQQEAAAKINGVSGEVRGVRTDLDATRTDLNATKEELANNTRNLGTLIARNSTELAELRKRGERDYVEFDIPMGKQYSRVGDVLVQLQKTDPKKQKYDVVINSDDRAILKKDRTANEPVTFLVGRDHVRYELVVNVVEKNKVRGYISAPKDKLMAAETPSLRTH